VEALGADRYLRGVRLARTARRVDVPLDERSERSGWGAWRPAAPEQRCRGAVSRGALEREDGSDRARRQWSIRGRARRALADRGRRAFAIPVFTHGAIIAVPATRG
jgi:hypothetical protein